MATEIFLPRLTHDMQSGVLVRWLKAEGETVAAGDLLYEVETDKAVSEVAAETSGILHRMDFREGTEIPIGTVIAYLLGEGEEFPQRTEIPAPAEAMLPRLAPNSPGDTAGTAAAQRSSKVATPIARRIAREKGIDLTRVAGTGPQGRIIERDVASFLTQLQDAAPPSAMLTRELAQLPYEVVPLTRTQITTGRRMALSSQSIPQFALEVDVDMTEAQRLRQHIGESGGSKPGYTAILVRVVAAALLAYPQVNASFDGEIVLRYKEINVGVAVAGPEGLLVPVIHAADRLHLDQIQAQLEEIRAQAERGVLDAVYLNGGTFTVSNLGMYGIDRFLALVNPPQAAILAAGRIRQLPWAAGNTIEVRPVLTLRLSVDHRVLDGSTAAPFLGEVRQLLENPYRLV